MTFRRRSVPLAWLQLSKDKLRLTVAVLGVAFAVVLVSMQVGFRAAMYRSAVRYHESLVYTLAMISPKTPFIGFPSSFSRRRLYQALGADGVASVTPLYVRQAFWKNPWRHNSRNILVVAFDPAHDVLALPEIRARLDQLKLPDVALFDAASRAEYGPVAAKFREAGPVAAEVNDRRVTIVGLFTLGTSFGIDGSLVTSDLNYQRMFRDRPPGFIELGLIHLAAGADPEDVKQRLGEALERDVLILTRADFIAREVRYWGSTTPIGYVFGFGAIMGLVVGGVIVYQILFADVSEHLAEYATLKAIGYTNRALSLVVLREAGILALLGFVPGLLITLLLYRVTAQATRLPLEMTFGLALTVLLLTLAMCAASAVVALRKVRATDPAEVFR